MQLRASTIKVVSPTFERRLTKLVFRLIRQTSAAITQAKLLNNNNNNNRMLFKLIVLCALVGSPALSSAVKGYSAPEASKGGRLLAPVEQQRLVELHQIKSTRTEQREEQRFEEHAPKLEESTKGLRAEHREEQQVLAAPLEGQQQLKQEELLQKTEETKGRYEARPQLSRDELKSLPAKPIETKVEQKTERFEQQHLVHAPVQEQLPEIREEQRRYEDLPLVQPIQPLTVIEEFRAEQLPLGATKGLVRSQQALVAPITETEPYAFSYQVDGSTRTESGDTKGVVKGQYTLQNADGSSRVVDYVADHNGFRASVNTNEFGTEAKSPAGVALRSSQPNAEDITLRLEGKTKEELGYTAAVKGAPVALPAKPENWAVKGPILQQELLAPQQPKRLVEELGLPVKGQQRLTQEEDYEPAREQQAPIKSAEIRSPKTLGELKQVAPVQARASFESATAHRDYRRPPPLVGYQSPVVHRVAHQQLTPPGVLVRAQPPPVLRAPVPAVSRAYLQRERYPPTPVQGYRRQYPVETPSVVNPRVSFYGPNSANPSSASFDDEQPGSFEHADS